MSPKVSVVVPVYNLEFYVERCLESLARQTFQEIEVLVVNDGSTDDSQLIIDEYVARHPGLFKSFVKPNGGHGAACNYGIERATGEYLMIVDGDDHLDHDTIAYMYEKAVETGADLLIGNLRYCYSDRTETFKPLPFEGERALDEKDRDLLFENWATPCGRLYKRSLFEDPDVRLLPGVFFADANFAPKSYLVAERIHYVDRELYNYDITRPTQSMKQTNRRILDIVPSLVDMLEFYRKKGAFEENRTRLMRYVVRHCVSWVEKVKRLSDYSKLRALQQLFAVCDEYFGSDWLQTGVVQASFGRRTYYEVRASRILDYYPHVAFWQGARLLRAADKRIESALELPAVSYKRVLRSLWSRIRPLLE